MTNVAIFKTSLNPDRSIQEDAQNVKQFTIIKFRFFSVFSFSSICPICLFLFNVRRFHVYCIFFVCHTRLAHTLKFIYENMFTSIFYILLPSRIICDASISLHLATKIFECTKYINTVDCIISTIREMRCVVCKCLRSMKRSVRIYSGCISGPVEMLFYECRSSDLVLIHRSLLFVLFSHSILFKLPNICTIHPSIMA